VLAEDGYLARANVFATVAAASLLGAALVLRTAALIPFAVAVLGAEYVAIVGFEADALDTRAPVVAGGLIALAELGYWSLELRGGVTDESGTYLRRIAVLATLSLGVVALGAFLLALVAAVTTGGPVVDVVGAAAAVGAVALLALASRGAAAPYQDG
jgi:hypothetical protein